METAFEFTDEQIKTFQELKSVFEELVEVIIECVTKLFEAIKKFGEYLGRILFYCQLRELKFSHKISLFISRKFPTTLAMRIGFSWFVRAHRLQ